MPTMTRQESAAKARASKQRKYHERLAAKLAAAGWTVVPPQDANTREKG